MRRLALLLALLAVVVSCAYNETYHECRMVLWMQCRELQDWRFRQLASTKACVARCAVKDSDDDLTPKETQCLDACYEGLRHQDEAACWRYAGHECRVGEASRKSDR